MMRNMQLVYQLIVLFADMATPSTGNPTPPEALPSYEGAFLKMLLTLVVLIVGIMGTVWGLKRMGSRSGGSLGRSIKILEKKPLSSKTMLYLIEIEGKQTLIAESQLEIKKLISLNTLSELDKEE